jgi:hypothetical protein
MLRTAVRPAVTCVGLAATVLLLACTRSRPAFQVLEIASPAAAGSAEPRFATTSDGSLILSWLERVRLAHRLVWAPIRENGVGKPREVARGTDWFVNWADFPSVTPIEGDLWGAHWMIKREGGPYAYDVAVALSSDRGISWKAPLTPHGDRTAAEHGFVSLIPFAGGVGAVWLDGRASEGGHGATWLQTASIDRGGAVRAERTLDDRVCDCCPTSAALAAAGPVVVYRDRSATEIRDIHVTRWVNGAWSKPRPVASDGWKIGGCPVNGPAIAARGNEVVVAWFTAAESRPRVRLARSADGGATFGQPLDVDSGGVFGRVGLVLEEDDDAIVSWLAGDSTESAELRLRRVARDGSLGAIHPISRTGAARAVGMPQLGIDGERLVLAWTEAASPSRLRVVGVTLP